MFGGVKDFCPNFPKLARKIFGPLFMLIFSQDDRFCDNLQRWLFMWFSTGCVPLFSNQIKLSAIFACIFREFAQNFTDVAKVFTDFTSLFRDFDRIFTKSKLLGLFKFFWFTRGVCFAFIFMTSSPIQPANIVAQSFIGFWAKIRVFRAPDRVSSVSGSKVMSKIFKKLQEAPRGLAEISVINILSFLP